MRGARSMTENEKLRSLLREAREEIEQWGVGCLNPIVRRIDAALAEPVSKLSWTDHPGGVDSTAFDEQTGTGITIAPEVKGFRWYMKSPGKLVISSAWFDTMNEAKASAHGMIEAFRKGVHRGE